MPSRSSGQSPYGWKLRPTAAPAEYGDAGAYGEQPAPGLPSGLPARLGGRGRQRRVLDTSGHWHEREPT